MGELGMTHVLVLVLGCVVGVSGSEEEAPTFLEEGVCAPLFLMEGFEAEQYLGTWYTIKSVPNTYLPIDKCMKDTIVFLDDDTMLVTTRGYRADGCVHRMSAKLTMVDDWFDQYLELKADLVPSVPYHVIETDYTSYSCVYSCYDILGLRAELPFILSRTQHISKAAEQRCVDLFEEEGVNTTKMVAMQQGDCPQDIEETHESDECNGPLETLAGEVKGDVARVEEVVEETVAVVEETVAEVEETVAEVEEVVEGVIGLVARGVEETSGTKILMEMADALEENDNVKNSELVERDTLDYHQVEGSGTLCTVSHPVLAMTLALALALLTRH